MYEMWAWPVSMRYVGRRVWGSSCLLLPVPTDKPILRHAPNNTAPPSGQQHPTSPQQLTIQLSSPTQSATASSRRLRDASGHDVWIERWVIRGMGRSLEQWWLYLLYSRSGSWFLHQSVLGSSSFFIYTAVVTVEWILRIANNLKNVWNFLKMSE